MTLRDPIFLVVEGNDGTGKSTLARMLAARFDATLFSTPPAELKGVRGHIDECYRGHDLSSQLFYASTVCWVSERVEAILAQGRSVVVDRYWLSTLVYDALRPGAIDLRQLEPRLTPAHATVLVVTEEQERRRRISQRGATPADEAALLVVDEINARFARALSRPIAGLARIVDSSHRTPEACADEIARWVPSAIADGVAA